MNHEKDEQLKSWILLLAGLVGIAYQQYTGKVNWILLLIFTTMTGVQGVANFIALIKSSPIESQSSFSRQQRLEQESPNVSSNSSESLDDGK